MAKVYYDPNEDELIPLTEYVEEKPRRFHIKEGSGLYYLFRILIILALTALWCAGEAQIFYEWWMHMNLWGLWFILGFVIALIYGALMYAIIEPDYVIIGNN